MTPRENPVWVLGGGGVAGIAWEVGLLAGLDDEGVSIAREATLIGTSAGSVVAAQVASGVALAEMYERQVSGPPFETSAELGLGRILRLARATVFSRSPEHAAQRVGVLAEGAGAPNNLALVAARLPRREWGARELLVTAVNTASGELRVFTRADGVDVLDAVAASCAVPMTSAPIEIGGARYMDGGMRSTLNLDLAPGDGPVIALAPSTAAIGRWASVDAQRARLGASRVVDIVTRDRASRRAQGRSVMNADVVPAIARAAREQGRRDAARVGAALGN